jgi:2-methylisocitrate lyase-like PEP mutase family enzyme
VHDPRKHKQSEICQTTLTLPAKLSTMNVPQARTDRFHALHKSGTFLMPNPFDIGSARLLEAMGFPAIATTSAGFAATLGRLDMDTTRAELVEHVRAIAGSVHIPLNVDAERCFADDPSGVGETIELLADAGAAGISIEDWNPVEDRTDDLKIAAERVKVAATAAHARGVVLTARADQHIHGSSDFADTVNRLRAYIQAGADVVYAPGITTPEQIEQIVALGVPVNVLLMPSTPTVPQLRDLGVHRISTGGALTWFAQGAFVAAAQQLLDSGTYAPANVRPPKTLLEDAFRKRYDDPPRRPSAPHR